MKVISRLLASCRVPQLQLTLAIEECVLAATRAQRPKDPCLVQTSKCHLISPYTQTGRLNMPRQTRTNTKESIRTFKYLQ